MVKILTEYLNGRKPEELISILTQQQVTFTIDIRLIATAPHYYTYMNLAKLMRLHNITNLTFRYLGNPYKLFISTNHLQCKESYLNMIHLTEEELQFLPNHPFHTKDIVKHDLALLLNYLADNRAKNHVFCFLCYCPTTNSDLCHRFWLKEYIESILPRITITN